MLNLSQKGAFMKQTYNNLIVSKEGVFETVKNFLIIYRRVTEKIRCCAF